MLLIRTHAHTHAYMSMVTVAGVGQVEMQGDEDPGLFTDVVTVASTVDRHVIHLHDVHRILGTAHMSA